MSRNKNDRLFGTVQNEPNASDAVYAVRTFVAGDADVLTQNQTHTDEYSGIRTNGFADAASAKAVLLAAAQSGAGRVRLTTQAYAADETKAITVLTGSSDVVGTRDAAILTEAGISGLTGASTWGDAVTAIGAS